MNDQVLQLARAHQRPRIERLPPLHDAARRSADRSTRPARPARPSRPRPPSGYPSSRGPGWRGRSCRRPWSVPCADRTRCSSARINARGKSSSIRLAGRGGNSRYRSPLDEMSTIRAPGCAVAVVRGSTPGGTAISSAAGMPATGRPVASRGLSGAVSRCATRTGPGPPPGFTAIDRQRVQSMQRQRSQLLRR